MLDHIGWQVRDVEASLEFYLRTFAAIGMREAMRGHNVDAVHHG
jgi:catechol 2,3-dioxygenase-like lactoylglutathione lyase family enzyme